MTLQKTQKVAFFWILKNVKTYSLTMVSDNSYRPYTS